MKKVDFCHLQERNTKWLKQRINNITLYKSVSSLIEESNTNSNTNSSTLPKLPNSINFNNINTEVIPEEVNLFNSTATQRFIIPTKQVDSEVTNKIQINPKNLFTEQTLQKIIKLRNIFLEFDEDGSKKLELNELETMFMKNNIPVTLNELVDLFFPNKKMKKNEEPYLNFFQLYLFATDSKSDHKFRVFMRKIKNKIEEKKKKETLDCLFINKKNFSQKGFNSNNISNIKGNFNSTGFMNSSSNNNINKSGGDLSSNVRNITNFSNSVYGSNNNMGTNSSSFKDKESSSKCCIL